MKKSFKRVQQTFRRCPITRDPNWPMQALKNQRAAPFRERAKNQLRTAHLRPLIPLRYLISYIRLHPAVK